ncbi:MBL fold metallo-hydrolase [Jannaschia aquimarina]|uniref:Rbn_1 protein n=1 Tax=Jannaschia aquimarina TaxID=935700 RepID=A0A0D1DB32_9RHOB|nr:MBL fold metallo-hydrolase [Jannaschia aquimarina]KIT17153.1 Ribonuclease BN [Jannaschia aquimarina]SNT17440.1 Phosphoribosyl 1,2-cyclic phosphodiesterase [Jannaschia aquimarina]
MNEMHPHSGATTDALTVRIWGARGSLPASGAAFDRYGAATCAVAVDAPGGAILLDAGSGLVALGADLAARGIREADLLLSHLHYDHVMGLPFFPMLSDPKARLRIHLGGATDEEARAALTDCFRQPFFPVTLDAFPAQITVGGLAHGTHAIAGARVEARALNHTGGATGYRVEADSASFAYITDFEHDGGAGDAAVLALARHADLALMDATYTPEEYASRRGWGHAHWRAAGSLAAQAGARNWGLFHHAHDRTDAALDRIETAVQSEFPSAFAARAGQIFRLGAMSDGRATRPEAQGGRIGGARP